MAINIFLRSSFNYNCILLELGRQINKGTNAVWITINGKELVEVYT